jgi:hypothetical protein
MQNDKTGDIDRYEDVKHLFRIYSYTYTYDYLNYNYGERSNEIDARLCNKSEW